MVRICKLTLASTITSGARVVATKMLPTPIVLVVVARYTQEPQPERREEKERKNIRSILSNGRRAVGKEDAGQKEGSPGTLHNNFKR